VILDGDIEEVEVFTFLGSGGQKAASKSVA